MTTTKPQRDAPILPRYAVHATNHCAPPGYYHAPYGVRDPAAASKADLSYHRTRKEAEAAVREIRRRDGRCFCGRAVVVRMDADRPTL
jgi:hypothetical protein